MDSFYLKKVLFSFLLLYSRFTIGQSHTFFPECIEHKPVTIKLYNETGYDIDSLFFQGTYIKHLKNIEMKEFSIDYYSTHSFPLGKVKNLKLYNANKGMWCGTGSKNYCDTTLLIDLKINKNADGNFLSNTFRKQ